MSYIGNITLYADKVYEISPVSIMIVNIFFYLMVGTAAVAMVWVFIRDYRKYRIATTRGTEVHATIVARGRVLGEFRPPKNIPAKRKERILVRYEYNEEEYEKMFPGMYRSDNFLPGNKVRCYRYDGADGPVIVVYKKHFALKTFTKMAFVVSMYAFLLFLLEVGTAIGFPELF